MNSQTISILIIALIVLATILVWRLRVLSRQIKELKFMKKSGEVLHGKSWENFAPFMEQYPYDPEHFRFLGNPIDGLSFEDDHIAFIEFKTGSSKLSDKQRGIKDLVEKGRVEWKEIRG